MDKYEYEERYGEKVIYCNRHNMSGIDGCVACDEEEREDREMVTCVTCHYKSTKKEDFVHMTNKDSAKYGGKNNPVCHSCYDDYMLEIGINTHFKNNNVDVQAIQIREFTDSLNTDYFE